MEAFRTNPYSFRAFFNPTHPMLFGYFSEPIFPSANYFYCSIYY
jgi:hypothetical protein